jgi:hypothetical protein
MHLLVLAFALLAAALAAIAFPGEAREQPNNIQLTSTPVNFARFSLGSERLGKLAFRGGIMLASDDERFGGFSGLAVSSDGRSLLAISDDGWWLKADLTYRADRLMEAGRAVLQPLRDRRGGRAKSKRNRDAEALALDPAGDLDAFAYVGFEMRPRIERFDLRRKGLAATPVRIPTPASIAKGPYNRQLEALGKLTHGPWKGSLIALSEKHFDKSGNIRGWILDGEENHGFAIKRFEDFDITDLAVLPDGSIITLERSYVPGGLPGMAIRRFSAPNLAPGSIIAPDLLFAGRQPFYLIDNMEGIAVHKWNGELRITTISDDNYNRGVQRTLLLQFALLP